MSHGCRPGHARGPSLSPSGLLWLKLEDGGSVPVLFWRPKWGPKGTQQGVADSNSAGSQQEGLCCTRAPYVGQYCRLHWEVPNPSKLSCLWIMPGPIVDRGMN